MDTALAQVEHRRKTLPETDEARRLHADRGRMAERVIEAETRVGDLTAEAGARRVIEALGAIVVCHETNKGYGGALQTIFATARDLGTEELVIIDSDGIRIDRLETEALAAEALRIVSSRMPEAFSAGTLSASPAPAEVVRAASSVRTPALFLMNFLVDVVPIRASSCG